MDVFVGCLNAVSISVQVLLNGIEAVMVLTLIILKQRALSNEVTWALDPPWGFVVFTMPVVECRDGGFEFVRVGSPSILLTVGSVQKNGPQFRSWNHYHLPGRSWHGGGWPWGPKRPTGSVRSSFDP